MFLFSRYSEYTLGSPTENAALERLVRAIATLEFILKENIFHRQVSVGNYLLDELQAFSIKHEHMGTFRTRGIGLLIYSSLRFKGGVLLAEFNRMLPCISLDMEGAKKLLSCYSESETRKGSTHNEKESCFERKNACASCWCTNPNICCIYCERKWHSKCILMMHGREERDWEGKMEWICRKCSDDYML